MFVTWLVSQTSGWLKAVLWKVECMLVTLLVSHFEMSPLKSPLLLNRPSRSRTNDTSHSGSGPCTASAAVASETHSLTAASSSTLLAKTLGLGEQLLPSLAQQFSFDGFKASHDVPEPLNCASAGRGSRDQREEVARDEAGRARGGERRRMCTDVCAPADKMFPRRRTTVGHRAPAGGPPSLPRRKLVAR